MKHFASSRSSPPIGPVRKIFSRFLILNCCYCKFIDFISLYLCLLYKFIAGSDEIRQFLYKIASGNLHRPFLYVGSSLEDRLNRVVLSIFRSFRYTLVVDFSCFFTKEILIFTFLQVVLSSCGLLEILCGSTSNIARPYKFLTHLRAT